MGLINWDDSLSVNVQEIDLQHQQLIKLINELHDAMRDRRTKAVTGGIIKGLIDYTKTHFSFEEKYFEQFSYPETSSHTFEHTTFVKKVSDFKKDFEEGKLMLSMEIMGFLKDWLLNHIKGKDKKYGPFFNEKGLK